MQSQQAWNAGHEAIDESAAARPNCGDGLISGPSGTTASTEDAVLVRHLKAGSSQAFEEMVRKFGGRLLATARRYLRSDHDAEDAVQDAFLCAFRSMSAFKGDSQLSTWLHRIVINSALMHLRAAKHHPDSVGTDVEELLPRFDRHGGWLGGCSFNLPAEFSLEVAETRSLVRRCIDRLPDSYRVVLVLRDIDELDTAGVGSLLGLTANAVKVRLHRARQALKALIERELML
jgi:RNA polymerase sigma-70 factor, ECF subfamily